jgi:hypothetical protein
MSQEQDKRSDLREAPETALVRDLEVIDDEEREAVRGGSDARPAPPTTTNRLAANHCERLLP